MPAFPESLTLRDGELELRRLSRADRDAIVEACRDPEIVRWTTLPDPFAAREVDLATSTRGTPVGATERLSSW